MLTEALKQGSKILQVFHPEDACDQYVIQVDKEEWQVTQDNVHEVLERLGSILKPEGNSKRMNRLQRDQIGRAHV